MPVFKLSVAFILVLALGQTVRAQTCESLFNNSESSLTKSNLEEAFLDEKNNEAFTNILANDELPFAKQILNQARVRDDVSFRQALIETLRAHHYTEDLISARIAQAESKITHTEKQWRQILGDLSLEETHTLFYGGNIKSISPTSLIGQY